MYVDYKPSSQTGDRKEKFLQTTTDLQYLWLVGRAAAVAKVIVAPAVFIILKFSLRGCWVRAALSMHMIKIKHGSDIHEWKGNKNKQREMLLFFYLIFNLILFS